MENENIFKNVNVIVGLVIIALSLIILFFGTITLIILIILISIGFLFAGFGTLYNALINTSLTKTSKYLKFIAGIITTAISISVLVIALVDPDFLLLVFINIFGLGLIVIGIARIMVGYFMETYPKTYRAALILVGTITCIFAFLILTFPTFGYFIILMMISLSLLLNGMIRVILGFVLKES
jgi:uncharacterized membrane protein HdeD (DUF308 family)